MSDDPPAAIREYVQENRDDLAYVLKHGRDETVRALALAALLRAGDERDREQVKQEIDRLAEEP